MNKKQLRKYGFIAAIVIIICAAATMLYQMYRSPISFDYYEPSYLPPTVTITDKRIIIIDDGKNRSEKAALRLEKTAWTYAINQVAHTTQTLGEAEQDYTPRSNEPSCSMLESPKRLEFRLCHWVDNWESHGGGEVSVYEVKFIKGSTYFWGRIPTSMDNIFTIDEIGDFIDSFKKVDIDGVRIERSRYWV